MSNAEYSDYLERLAKVLPRWESEYRDIDERVADLSYKDGKFIMGMKQLDIATLEQIRNLIQQERTEPRTSRQLQLATALGSIYEGIGSIGDLLQGAKEAPWPKDPEALFKEISTFRIPLMNHVEASVERLEAANCNQK